MGDDPETYFSKDSEAQIISSSSSGDWIGRPTILDDGAKWIIVYRAGDQHAYDSGGQVHIRFSTDEGDTWTDEDTFTDSNPVSGAPFISGDSRDSNMPCVIVAPNGDLLLWVGRQPSTYPNTDYVAQWRSTDAGASWSSEDLSIDAHFTDGVVIGSDIYIAAYATDPDNDTKAVLYKSADNGTSYSLVGDITSWTADSVNVDECSVCNPSGNKLVVIMRSRGAVQRTYLRISNDLGATWGNVISLTNQLGVIQRPRLRIFSDEPTRIYLIGRDYTSTTEYTIVSYSDDGGYTWMPAFALEDSSQTDCGYADVLKNSSGKLYCTSYRGTYSASTIYEYIVSVL